MADPLSMASAVAGLVSLADVVLTKTYHYLSAVKSAEKDIKELQILLESMYGTMNVLKTRLRVLDNLSTMSTSLYTRPGIIDDCTRLLDDINQKLAHYDFGKNTSKMKQHLQKLRWPFESSQTSELVEKLSRFNQVLVTALQGDTLSAVYETFRAASEIRDDIKKLERSLSVKINNLIDFELDKAQQEAFDYYNRCDPTLRHEAAKRLCQQGTGRWFTESDIFTAWFEGTRSKLWLSGIPGAGKTILASSIIQRARLRIAQLANSAALVYFYCDYKDTKSHEIDNILCTIAAQLGQQATEAIALLTQQYNTFHKPGRASTFKEPPDLLDTIQSLCSYYQNVFFIIDGLDECGKNVTKITKRLKEIVNAGEGTIRCIFLSRTEFDIERTLLPDFEEVKIAAQSYDLKLFVHSQLEDIDDDDPEFKSEILDTFVTKADGMFRWVACQIDYLRDLPSIEERKKALHELPPDLNSSYDRILERVNQKPSSTQEMVRLTLTWLILGRQWDLGFAALREALAVRRGQTKLQRDKIPNEQTVLRHCSSLVRRTADGNDIEPAHFTVAEYLKQIPVSHQTLSQYRIDEDAGGLLLAETCLTYLRFEDFGDMRSTSQAEQRNLEYKFRRHAVEQWPIYARPRLADETCFTMVIEFCSDMSSANHLAWLFDYIWYNKIASNEWEDQKTEAGSEQLSGDDDEDCQDIRDNEGSNNGDDEYDREYDNHCNKDIAEGNDNEDRKNSTKDLVLTKLRGWTPIHCASILRLPEVIKFLSQMGAGINLRSALGTPIQLAILADSALTHIDGEYHDLHLDDNCSQIVQILLEAGADPTIEWYDPIVQKKKTILQLVLDAVDVQIEQRAELITLILKAGLRLNRHIVESLGDTSLIRLFGLFPSVIKLEHIQDDYQAGWLDAIRHHSEDSKSVVLAASIDTDQQDLLHALLRSAAQADQAPVLEKLLSRQEVNINAVDDKGRTALSLAAEFGSLQALRLLLDRGADVNATDVDGWTIFHYSLCSGMTEPVEMIYHSGVHTDAEDSIGRTAWWHAGWYGNIAALRLFQAEYQERNESYCSALAKKKSVLFAAAKHGRDEAVIFLTQITGTTAVCDSRGRNLAHYCNNLTTDTLRKLVDLKLNCSKKDRKGRTPLHKLCTKRVDLSFCDKIEILLQQGCTVVDTCGVGNTPLHTLFQNTHVVIDEKVLHLLCTDAVLETTNFVGLNPFDFLLLYQWSSSTSFDIAFDYLTKFHARPASNDSCNTWLRVILTDNRKSKERSSQVLAKLLEVWPPTYYLEFQSVIESIGVWAALHGISNLLETTLNSGVDIFKRKLEVANAHILELVCTGTQDAKIIDRVLRNITKEQILQKDPKMKSLLHLTCGSTTSNPVVITKLLSKGWDINEQDLIQGRGFTPLMQAAKRGNDKHIRVLLEAKADLGICDYDGWNVFAHACHKCGPSTIQQLMDCCNDDRLWWKSFSFKMAVPRKDVRRHYQGSNILHLTSAIGDAESLEMILKRWPGADPNQLAESNMTPLHIACSQPGTLEVVKLLVSVKANVNLRDNRRRTPLHWAATRHSFDTVRILVESGAEINVIDQDGNTPLHLAAGFGSKATALYLLKEGAVSMHSAAGLTPELAAYKWSHKELADMITQYCTRQTEQVTLQKETKSELKRLRIYNSFIEAISRSDKMLVTEISTMLDKEGDPPCSGCTPVSVALRTGNTELIELLLSLDYRLRSCRCLCDSDRNGLNAMQEVAARPNLKEFIDQLFSKVYIGDQQRLLAFHQHPAVVAAKSNNLSYLQKFFNRFCVPAHGNCHPVSLIKLESNTKGNEAKRYPLEIWRTLNIGSGAGLLHVAAAFNHLEIARFLSTWPEMISCTDNSLATALHYAAVYGAVKVVDFLLDNGADIEARTSWGTTPLFLAASRGKRTIVHRLVKRGAQTKFSNIQSFCETAVFRDLACREILLATGMPLCNLDPLRMSMFDSFTYDLSSICFASNDMVALFTARHFALGHYIVFNGIRLLKHFLRWLRLHQILAQQLEFSNPSALCLAAQHGDTKVIDHLLNCGSNVNSWGCEEGPALMVACRSNRLEVVRLLVRKGAELSCRSTDGKILSCLQAAERYQQIVKWFLVGQHNEQYRLKGTQDYCSSDDLENTVRSIKPWSGLHTVESPLPPEFRQARGDTLLEWHIRKRHDLRAYEGRILHYGEGIEYPFFNYE